MNNIQKNSAIHVLLITVHTTPGFSLRLVHDRTVATGSILLLFSDPGADWVRLGRAGRGSGGGPAGQRDATLLRPGLCRVRNAN